MQPRTKTAEIIEKLRLLPLFGLIVVLLIARYVMWRMGANRSVGDYILVVLLYVLELLAVSVLALRFARSHYRSIQYGAALGAVAMIVLADVLASVHLRHVAIILFLVLLAVSACAAWSSAVGKKANMKSSGRAKVRSREHGA